MYWKAIPRETVIPSARHGQLYKVNDGGGPRARQATHLVQHLESSRNGAAAGEISARVRRLRKGG